MRILITGGYGYLGGRLSQYLEDNTEHKVIIASRRRNTSPQWLPNVKIVQIDWDNTKRLDEICSGIDAVVHLAGMNAQDCSRSPAEALQVNAVTTAKLLMTAIRHNVSRFIYLSTAHVYASPLVGTISEDTCPVNLHPYATSHRAGEDVVRSAHALGKIEGLVIRLSNAYGAPAHKNANCWMLLVNDLCRQVATTKEILLHSSGQQRRDFITMTDTVKGIIHLLELENSKLVDGLFNLGNGTDLRVIEMANYIAERAEALLGFKASIQCHNINQPEETQMLNYRIDKLLNTGFNIKGDLKNEIDETLKFCLANFGFAE